MENPISIPQLQRHRLQLLQLIEIFLEFVFVWFFESAQFVGRKQHQRNNGDWYQPFAKRKPKSHSFNAARKKRKRKKKYRPGSPGSTEAEPS